MPRRYAKRATSYRQFKCGFTVRERLALEELRVLAMLSSEADVIRLAVQNLARHYDYDVDLKLFTLRNRRDPRKKADAA